MSIIQHDSYYRNRGDLPPSEREEINYDHPGALDTPLLVSHLEQLRQGLPVMVPVYNYATHSRSASTHKVEPAPVVILEGILILTDPRLRDLMDLRVFVDTDPDVRVIRRVERDLVERGRTMRSVIDQYLTTVRPMHLKFVEPSKRYADLTLDGECLEERAVDEVAARIRAALGE